MIDPLFETPVEPTPPLPTPAPPPRVGGKGATAALATFGTRATRVTTARIVPTSFFMTFSFLLFCLIADNQKRKQYGCQ